MSNNTFIKWLIVAVITLAGLNIFIHNKCIKYYKLYQQEAEKNSELEFILLKHNIHDKLTLPESKIDSTKISR